MTHWCDPAAAVCISPRLSKLRICGRETNLLMRRFPGRVEKKIFFRCSMASKKHSNNSEVITLSGTIKGGSAPGPKPKPKPKPKQKPPANETRIRTPKKAAGRVAINLPFLGEASASWMKPVQFDRWARDTSHKPRAMAINTTAPQTVVPNYYMEKRRADNGEDCTALFGTDAVTSLVLSADATPGDILFQIGLTPFLFPETRLYTLCQLWERFRFIRLQFEYVPIASSFNSGQLLGFYDSDIQVSWVSGTANFQKASALGVQGPNQVSQDKTWNIPDPAFTNMFTNQGGVDLRLQQQGQFIIMANSILDHTVTPSLGNLYIRYEVELFSPCSSQAPVAYTSTLGGGASPGTAPFGLTAPYDGRFFNNLPVTYDNNGGTRSDFTFNGSGQAGSVFVLFLNVRYSGTIWTTVGLNEVGLGTAFVTESTTAANTVQFTYAYSVLTPDFTWGFSLTGGAFTIVSTRVTFNLGPQVGLSPLSEMRALLAEQAKEKVRRRDNLENEVNALKMQLAEFIESRSAPLRKDNKRLSSPSGSRIRVLREYDSVEEGETDVV